MGLFSRNTSNAVSFPWIEIESLIQLNEVLQGANEKPILLFKHSTRCSISIMALNRFQKEWNIEDDRIVPYFVDLLEHSDVSNAIETMTEVQHQSPQAIVWSKNRALYSASHNGISASKIQSLEL
jgi:bacillithiol system protein YtxJ